MSKIVKNNTVSAIEIADVGVTVPASGQYTIPEQDYLLWAASSDIITEVGAGNLVINDGSQDLSISDGISLIKGFYPHELIGGTDGTVIGNVGDSLKVNVTSSVLPTGASTEIKQDTQITEAQSTNTKLDTLNSTDFSTETTLAALETKASTEVKQDLIISELQDIEADVESTNAKLDTLNTNVSKEAKQDTQITNQNTLNTRVGDLTETAPATDTASSGLNGRLQRIAQRVSDLITAATTGTGLLSTIRGASDGTAIGNIDDSLKVSVSPIDSGELTTFKSDTEVVLGSDTVYTVLHSITGEGLFVGATFVVDNTEVECRVRIDGNTVFEFTGNFLKEVVNVDDSFTASGIFGVTNDGKRLYFTPNTPFEYSNSLEFSARRSGKKVKYQLYTYSEK